MALASGGAASIRGVTDASFWVTAVRLQLFVEVDLVEGFYESGKTFAKERKLFVHVLKWFRIRILDKNGVVSIFSDLTSRANDSLFYDLTPPQFE